MKVNETIVVTIIVPPTRLISYYGVEKLSVIDIDVIINELINAKRQIKKKLEN